MATVEEILALLKQSLLSNIPVAGLIKRNPTAHKWKATFRTMMLREAVFWRLQDLLAQSLALYKSDHALGARILLRSAFETLAVLIYLNQLMAEVLEGKLNFHEFADKTTTLLMGARNDEDLPQAINILTVLKKCDKKYRGLMDLYADLSESAHPNYDGLCAGFAQIDHDEYETNFSNRWMERYGASHPDSIMLCVSIFQHEYDDVWKERFERLEAWIAENDAELEATKGVVAEGNAHH